MDICKAGDIAFHFNPRFDEDHKKVIVCNSCIGNKWGREERSSNFPFVPGQPFEVRSLIYTTENNLIQVHVCLTLRCQSALYRASLGTCEQVDDSLWFCGCR